MSLESSVSFWDWLSFWLVTWGAILASLGGISSIMFRRYNHQLVVLTERHNREDKQANERAIADAGARAAEAEARTAQANLEIARLTTPRQLSPDQQQHIVSALKAFAPQKFSLAVSPETEPLNLLANLKNLLLLSGWIQTPPTGFGDIAIGDAASAIGNGVIPRFASSAIPRTREAANALAAALNAQGIESKVESDPRVHDPSEINLLVGSKPIWR
jgi:hypothetical protein